MPMVIVTYTKIRRLAIKLLLNQTMSVGVVQQHKKGLDVKGMQHQAHGTVGSINKRE